MHSRTSSFFIRHRIILKDPLTNPTSRSDLSNENNFKTSSRNAFSVYTGVSKNRLSRVSATRDRRYSMRFKKFDRAAREQFFFFFFFSFFFLSRTRATKYLRIELNIFQRTSLFPLRRKVISTLRNRYSTIVRKRVKIHRFGAVRSIPLI